MPKLGEVYQNALAEAKALGIEGSDVRYLLIAAEGYSSPADVIYYKDRDMRHLDLFESYFEKRKKGMPVQYATGHAPFLGFDLEVDERVLIPRPETEELCALITEKVWDYFDPRNYLVVADIGTGSGCIALTLKNSFPNWLITASDIKQDALDVAKLNFKKYEKRIDTLRGDALTPFIEKNMALDIIVSNPPYVKNEEAADEIVRDNEPDSALYIGEGLGVYEKIFKDLDKVKRGSILLAFEIDDWLVEGLRGLVEKYTGGKGKAEFVKDLSGRTRFLFVYVE